MSRRPNLVETVENHCIDNKPVDHYARTYPTFPDRLRGVVEWLDANLKTAGLVFMVERIDKAAAAWQDDWAKRFDLTPAEIRLAAHLINGGTVASHAKQHAISRNTARNQLQAVYGKTGTHRQAELVSMLLKA